MHNSTNPNWHHASFGVNFKKFIKGQKIGGSEKINLKWFKDDGMYAREVYCYDLFKRFGVWTAPLSSYCRLYLKIKEDPSKTYYGVYQLLEPVDKEYVKRRSKGYPDSKGNLWKANYGADFVSTSRDNMGIENVTLTENYKPIYDLKTNEEKLEQAKDQLVSFIGNLNSKTGDNFKEWISSIMDVDLFLKTYAVNVTCGMWDDYWNNKNNFYFYFDSNGKFYFIPYDYDNSLGTSLIMNDAGKQDMLRWGNDGHPLVKKIIAIPEYKALYVGYIKELCDEDKDYFHVDKSIPRIQKWQSTISSYISNDTGEDMNLVDEPASWGNCPHYRLLDRNSQNNYFIVRANNIPK
jgi:spore coat protein CotH